MVQGSLGGGYDKLTKVILMCVLYRELYPAFKVLDSQEDRSQERAWRSFSNGEVGKSPGQDVRIPYQILHWETARTVLNVRNGFNTLS